MEGKQKLKYLQALKLVKDLGLEEKRMPFMRGNDYIDLYVQVNTEVPVSLNKEQKELLEKFREIENEKSNPSFNFFFSFLNSSSIIHMIEINHSIYAILLKY